MENLRDFINGLCIANALDGKNYKVLLEENKIVIYRNEGKIASVDKIDDKGDIHVSFYLTFGDGSISAPSIKVGNQEALKKFLFKFIVKEGKNDE